MLANNAFFPPSYNRRTGSVLSYEKIIIRESFCCTTTAIKVKSGKPLLEMNQTCFVLHFEAPPSYTTERTNALEFRAKEKKQTEDAAITDTDGKTISQATSKRKRRYLCLKMLVHIRVATIALPLLLLLSGGASGQFFFQVCHRKINC